MSDAQPETKADENIQISCSAWTKVFVETMRHIFDGDAQVESVTAFINLVKKMEEAEKEAKENKDNKDKLDLVKVAASNLQLVTSWALACVYKTNNIYVQREGSLFLNSIEEAFDHLKKALVIFDKEGILEVEENDSSTPSK